MSPVKTFFHLIRDQDTGAAEIKEFLDRQDHQVRLDILHAAKRLDMELLWEKTEGFLPLTADDLVPADQSMLSPVSFAGKNSLPIWFLTRFRKSFYRYCEYDFEAQGPTTYGRNFQWSSFATGPGYFRVSGAKRHGELLFDYSYIPGRAPAGWGRVRGNDAGLPKVVYGGLQDTLRKLSNHFIIARAVKGNGKPTFFLLCREEA